MSLSLVVGHQSQKRLSVSAIFKRARYLFSNVQVNN